MGVRKLENLEKVLKDKNLSLKAKGLYSLIFINKNFNKESLKSMCSEGKEGFENTWKELKEKGYLIQKKEQKNGRFNYIYSLKNKGEKING